MSFAPALLAVLLAPAPVVSPGDGMDAALVDTASLEPETLALADAEAILLQESPDLAMAAASIDEAQAVVRQAMAALLPIVSASANYTRNNAEATIDFANIYDAIGMGITDATGLPVMIEAPAGAGQTIIQPLQSLTASGQLRVPLFAANAYWDVKAARKAVENTRANRAATQNQLRGALVRAAWLAGAAESFVGVAEHALGGAQAHLESAKALLEVGKAVPLDVEQARLQVLRRRTDLAQAHAELARTRTAVGTLLGRDHPVRIELPAPEDPGDATRAGNAPMSAADTRDAIALAMTRRPELRAARLGEDQARHRITSANMRLAPTLVGTFGGSASTVAYPTGLNTAWQLGVGLSWTLYDGGFRYGARRQADAGLARANAQRRKLELQVSQEIQDAARDLSLARMRLALAKEETALASAAAASARRSFAEGGARSLDVLDAMNAEFQAELRHTESVARLAAARVDLQTALGDTTDRDPA